MTTKKTILLVALTAIASIAATAVALRLVQDEPDVVGPTSGEMQSTILGERREYFVHLPEGYATNNNARYPVLYVLDGTAQSNHSADSAALLARVGIVPPMIVVGVPNINRGTRERDFAIPDQWIGSASAGSESGAARFLSFLEKELIPKIEADFRTARPRMLAGWSAGGLFVLYSQIASPALFDGRFAHSAHIWGNDDPTVTRIEEGLKATAPTSGFLHITLGSEEANEMKDPFKRVVQMLETNFPIKPESKASPAPESNTSSPTKSNSSPGFRWRTDISVGGGHNSNPVLSTPVGLCEMFSPSTGQACHPVQR